MGIWGGHGETKPHQEHLMLLDAVCARRSVHKHGAVVVAVAVQGSDVLREGGDGETRGEKDTHSGQSTGAEGKQHSRLRKT